MLYVAARRAVVPPPRTASSTSAASFAKELFGSSWLLSVCRYSWPLEILFISVHGVTGRWNAAVGTGPIWNHQLPPWAHHCREQHGDPAAGPAGTGDQGGPEEREHSTGPRSQRGRFHEHTSEGRAVPGQKRSAHPAAGAVYHRQERPLRSHPRPHRHNEDYREPAGQDPQSPKLCQPRRRQEGVHQESKITYLLSGVLLVQDKSKNTLGQQARLRGTKRLRDYERKKPNWLLPFLFCCDTLQAFIWKKKD